NAPTGTEVGRDSRWCLGVGCFDLRLRGRFLAASLGAARLGVQREWIDLAILPRRDQWLISAWQAAFMSASNSARLLSENSSRSSLVCSAMWRLVQTQALLW